MSVYKGTEEEIFTGLVMWVRYHIDRLRGFDLHIKQNANFYNLTKICEGLDPFYKKFIVDFKLTFVDNSKIQSLFENKIPKIVTFLEFKGELAKHSKALSESMKKDRVVSKLRVCWSDMTTSEFKEITSIAAYNEKLTDLDLSGNLFGVDGAKNLVENLGKNASIKKLNISYNNINRKGITVITDFLIENPVIKFLNLEGNNLTKSMDLISKLVATNIFIKELNLSSCSISENELKILFEGLRKNKTIRKLQLNDNKFKKDGVKIICDFLRENTPLKNLELMGSDINFDAAIQLYDILKVNYTLDLLAVSGNCLTASEKNFFQQNPDFSKYKKRILF